MMGLHSGPWVALWSSSIVHSFIICTFGEVGQYIADYKKRLSKIKFWFISDVRAKCTNFRIMGNGTKPSLKNEIC